MNIAIIGTAGRAEDGIALRSEQFGEMHHAVHKIIQTEIAFNEPYSVVSGGAAWADHLAVFTFLLSNAYKLYLELPCPLTPDGRFVDTGERDFRTNPGGTSNYYHELFSKKVGINSFKQLKEAAQSSDCVITSGGGFFERNTQIALKADHCIALTFGKKDLLKDGGTMDTMSKFLKKGTGKSFHVDLHDMTIYSPARIK